MRSGILAVFVMAFTALAFGQNPRFEINAETPEGKLLQMGAQEENEGRKVSIFEDFVKTHPQHAGVPWAYGQLLPIYLKNKEYDKTIQGASAALAIDPANPVIAYQALQASEQKKDYAGIRDWSSKTVDAAKKMLAIAKPEDEDDLEVWKRDQDYSTQVIQRAEYAIYAAGVQATEPQVIIDLRENLATRNPKSQYLDGLNDRYLIALRQSNQNDKAIAFAEDRIAAGKASEDTLALAAGHYMDPKSKNNDKALSYSQKLVDLMNTKPVPEGVSPADWDKKKSAMLGLGNWMQGMVYAEKNQWAETDRTFREALPNIQGKNEMLAPAYFHLGVANYRMKKIADAKKYSQACVAIPGPYRAQAQKNLAAMANMK